LGALGESSRNCRLRCYPGEPRSGFHPLLNRALIQSILAAKGEDPDIPALFRQARYVYVEAVDGDEFNPRLYPEDREVIADVRHPFRRGIDTR
jgi:hypothetical protein